MRGQAAHPDAEVLAEFRAGLIGGMRGRRLAAHVAGCPECAAAGAGLAAVSAALAAVPVPSLPDPVAARIGMALAAEASARRTAGPPAPAANRAAANRAAADGAAGAGAGHGKDTVAPRGHGSRGGGRRLRPVRPAILVPAAICLLVAVGGGLLLNRPGGSPGRSSAASGTARTPVMGANATGGPQALPNHISPNTAVSGLGSSVHTVIVISSGTDYLRATLRSQVETQLRERGRRTALASPALSRCARKVTGGAWPLFVDRAKYQSRAAYVIVTDARVWVVGTGCTAASPDRITSAPLRVARVGAGISTP